jgi:hypothetical protein
MQQPQLSLPITSAQASLPSGRRVGFVVGVLLYFCVFAWSYYRFLLPWQESWGFSDNSVEPEYWLLALISAVAPACWAPINLRRPSELLYLFQYLVLFVPTPVVLLNSGRPILEPIVAVEVSLVMSASLGIMALAYAVPLMRIPDFRLPARLYWPLFVLCFSFLLLMVVNTLGGNFNLVTLDAINSVRKVASQIVEQDQAPFVWYAQLWLAGAFLPLLFAVAVKRKSILGALVVAAVYIFLYGITGTKTTLLAVPILFGLIWVTRAGRRQFVYRLILGLMVALSLPSLFELAGSYQEFLEKWWVTLVHARIFGVPQLIVAQYVGYFQQHEVTLWSHISGIDFFVPYPYVIDVPRTLGYFFYGSPVGLNAGLWVQDGLAAAGLLGIPIVSAFAAAMFWLFDSAVQKIDPKFAAVSLGMIAIWFTNAPLTTTILSSGWLVLSVLLMFYPAEDK